MEIHKIIMGFVGILREACQIFLKNGKLMVSIVLLHLLVGSFLYLINIFSTKPIINDIFTKLSSLLILTPGSPEFFGLIAHLKRDWGFFLGVEWINLFVYSMASLYFASITILASAMVHRGKDLTLKDVLLAAARSWKRPIVTWFYTTIFGLGYFFLLFLIFLLPVMLIIDSPAVAVFVSRVVIFLALAPYVYIAVIWTLALVISVLEEKCGIEAIGKAAQIVKGMKISGFLLNLLFTIVPYIMVQVLKLIHAKPSTATQIVVGLVATNFVCLVHIYWLMAYTIFYYQCKKTHEEEAEFQGFAEYAKLPTAPQIGENVL